MTLRSHASVHVKKNKQRRTNYERKQRRRKKSIRVEVRLPRERKKESPRLERRKKTAQEKGEGCKSKT